jgi:3-hydroxyisobutyrate dehydrogenase-like beta-hydroxyacid dehydrogenase
MLKRHFEDEDFELHLMLKDTRYAIDLVMSLRAPADMTTAAEAPFARAESKGLGDKDFSAVAAA